MNHRITSTQYVSPIHLTDRISMTVMFHTYNHYHGRGNYTTSFPLLTKTSRGGETCIITAAIMLFEATFPEGAQAH